MALIRFPLPPDAAAAVRMPACAVVEAVLHAVIDTVEPDRAGAEEGLKALIAALFIYARAHSELAADPRAITNLTIQTVTDLAARQPQGLAYDDGDTDAPSA